MAFGAKVLLLEGESANGIQERRAERAFSNSRGRGVPRASALMRLFYQPASTRTESAGRYRIPKRGFIFDIYRGTLETPLILHSLLGLLIMYPNI